MEPISDQTELLEQYLDGTLEADEAARVEALLREDAAMRDTLEQLRLERDLRVRVFASLEGGHREADAAAERFVASVARREHVRRLARMARFVAAAAAVVLIGFGIGWTGRAALDPQPGPVTPVAQGEAASYRVAVAVTDDAGNVVAVQPFSSIDEAERFSRDLKAWQDNRRQLEQGGVLLVGDRF